MTQDQINAELDRLDEEDAARNARINAIKAVAKANADVALDQGDIDGYEDNMNDTLVEQFQDLTNNEWNIAADTFNRLVGRSS